MKFRRVLEFPIVLGALAVLIPWITVTDTPQPEDKSTDPAESSAVEAPPGRLAVDGVWLGMTKDQLLSNLGEPSRNTPSHAGYEQWDYFLTQRTTLMLDAGDKVVSVDGTSLTRDGKAVVSPGMELTSVEEVLGKSREPLETLPDSVNPGFSIEGQLVHLEHRGKKVHGRVQMAVDYSVVRPPQQPVRKPPPDPEGVVLHEPPPLRQPPPLPQPARGK